MTKLAISLTPTTYRRAVLQAVPARGRRTLLFWNQQGGEQVPHVVISSGTRLESACGMAGTQWIVKSRMAKQSSKEIIH